MPDTSKSAMDMKLAEVWNRTVPAEHREAVSGPEPRIVRLPVKGLTDEQKANVDAGRKALTSRLFDAE